MQPRPQTQAEGAKAPLRQDRPPCWLSAEPMICSSSSLGASELMQVGRQILGKDRRGSSKGRSPSVFNIMQAAYNFQRADQAELQTTGREEKKYKQAHYLISSAVTGKESV